MDNMEMLISALQEVQRREKSGGLDPSVYNNRAAVPGRNQLTWSKYKEMVNNGQLRNVRTKDVTLGNSPLYGCSGLFGLCGPDDIIGWSMRDDPMVTWLGFYPDQFCEKSIKGLTYIDQAGTAAGSVEGTVYGSACADPPTSEKGVCEYYIGDFGTLRACGEGVDVSNLGVRKCDKQPVYTLPIEGIGPVRIDNDLDLETLAGALLVKHEVSREIITGDKNTAYQFDGLVNLVKTGYVSIKGNRCEAMDSVITDWGNDDMTGAVNGHGSIITKVRDMWRRIKWRIQQSSLGMPAEGDVVLAMPSWLAYQFLDEWAFWSFKNSTGATGKIVTFDGYALRDTLDKFSGGLYGAGYINIDGFNIHILPHDWAPVSQSAPSFCSDIYLLTRNLGGRQVLMGQYVPVDVGADAVAKAAGARYFGTESMQGGRALRWLTYDNACVKPCILFRPRLFLETPWAQGRIENVCVSTQFDPMSPDPQSHYFIEGNKVVAIPVTQYWYDDEGWFHDSVAERIAGR
jgi:hypothetical protein